MISAVHLRSYVPHCTRRRPKLLPPLVASLLTTQRGFRKFPKTDHTPGTGTYTRVRNTEPPPGDRKVIKILSVQVLSNQPRPSRCCWVGTLIDIFHMHTHKHTLSFLVLWLLFLHLRTCALKSDGPGCSHQVSFHQTFQLMQLPDRAHTRLNWLSTGWVWILAVISGL